MEAWRKRLYLAAALLAVGGALCFEGNIHFYGKSGFSYAGDFGIRYHGLPEGRMRHSFSAKS